MITARDNGRLQSVLQAWRKAGQTIALVPTMGNLHHGHLSLLKQARQEADRVVTSLFVNPAQFGPDEDFQRYPRTPEEDLLKLEQAGCDLAWRPGVGDIYPHGLEQSVRLLAPPALASILEGEQRPGHFDGVVTVVCRLFNLVQPDLAVFGEKDYQQLLIIRHMSRDLGLAVRIVAAPTVREAGGLALSSRNQYLSEDEHRAAGVIHAALEEAAQAFSQTESSFAVIEGKVLERLEKQGLRTEYVSIRRNRDLAQASDNSESLRMLIAAWCGQTRLIDNKLFY